MFTGIIEAQTQVLQQIQNASNIDFWFKTPEHWELYIDQSIAHNGICLTVVEIQDGKYRVTAVQETLKKTNAKFWTKGTKINLERSLLAGQRMDGHFVQGHVDDVVKVIEIKESGGSWNIRFSFDKQQAHLLIPRGSVTLDGISLTIADLGMDWLEVAIIPYTWQHTNIHALKLNQEVNVEFDILGKYLARWKSLAIDF